MNETLKRSISGAVYIVLLLASILFSIDSFFVLFGIFLLITVVEFWNLIQLNKAISLCLAAVIYLLFYYITNFKYYDLLSNEMANNITLFALITTLIVSMMGISFLFVHKEHICLRHSATDRIKYSNNIRNLNS